MIQVSRGPEDFALDATGPRLIVAALERPKKRERPGKFWSIDLAGPQKHQPQEMAVAKEIYPTGIALQMHRLYVTNNPPGERPSIEVFRVDGNMLAHERSLPSDRKLRNLNDVVALKNGDLFVSDADARKVYYVDAKNDRWTDFATVLIPNGLAVDSAERYVFVNSLLCRRMYIYDFRGKLIQKVRLPGHADNLQWEVQDAILDAALHPSLIRIFRHLKNRDVRSPSRGVRIDVRDIRNVQVTSLYDLPDFSGGSTALVYGDTLYVSQVVLDQIYTKP